MKWQFSELQTYKDEPLPFNETVTLKEDLLSKFGDVIKDITPVTVSGFAQSEDDDVFIHAHVTGELVTPSTRSLQPVTLPIDLDIDEIYIQDKQHEDRYSDEESVILVDDGKINFDEAILEYIVLSIPLQVLTDEEAKNNTMPAGKDWSVISEETYENQKQETKQQNTPLSGLADLFKDDEK
ncbi:DUF177 domain-containing protein [Weissella paramesenteroides]|mgnify:FL=1|jgi:uncharacterized protein|uniref:DUF177 domain-containing protein n=2 Tax=Weissella paramesenteroides TaxID=1249 RepID=A0ABD4XHQ2_WEIPA|nr:YceD family protein [Weissella paramesenteroides]ATF40786.1 nucleotide-binding protein [Weissella paramesenteroides]KAA8440068.1 DUF177 domain-containing protein [Weissella paramesenteroides]KAA8441088.1 DUF177 domain-containing protein [Weissella paramesenteroides]KAA8443137.1 DUF177 domain-containing protein [Weissella paramesenteroides]KAA8445499.1 DUF177 domain-containing protein [Weissella paramesenteroides]